MLLSIISLSSSSSSSMAVLFCLHVFLLVISRINAVITLPGNMTIPALIIFGDSIVDQGNNNNLNTFARCNYSPYGKDFRGGIPTGRFCNGKTPADLVAEELGIKEYLPAYLDPNFKDEDALTGASFASGGTGFDPLTSHLSDGRDGARNHS